MIRRVVCKRCKGNGYVWREDPVLFVPISQDCPKCYGTGFDGSVESLEDEL